MSAPGVNPRLERAFQIAIDIGERIFILLLYATLVASLSHTIGERPYNLLLLFSEGLVALFVIVRRPAFNISVRPLDWVIALVGTTAPMLFRAGGQPVLPEIAGTVLMFAGLSLAICAKLSLNRRFGIAAANRGAVVVGPYRFVRHPMYAGYVIVFAGFLLNNPLPWNLVVYALTITLLLIRIMAEERVLRMDPVYAEYAARARFRLIPFLF